MISYGADFESGIERGVRCAKISPEPRGKYGAIAATDGWEICGHVAHKHKNTAEIY